MTHGLELESYRTPCATTRVTLSVLVFDPAVEEMATVDEEEVVSRSADGVKSGCRCVDSKSEAHCSQPGMAWCYVRGDSGCPDAATARTMRGLRTWSKAACDGEK